MLNYFKAFSVFSLWTLIALTTHYYISNRIFNTCNTNLVSQEITILNKNTYFLVSDDSNTTIYKFPIGFTINKHKTNVSSIHKVPYLIDSIQHILANDYSKVLIITGKYLENEIYTELNKNIGLERAQFLKKELINNGFNSSKIKISSKISNFSFNKNEVYNNGIEMKFSAIQQNKLDSLESSITTKTLYIEFKNDSLISNKELKDYSLLLKQYFRKHNGKKILITGHTDNLGYYENNLIIGLIRANKVKEYFINNGIDFNKIETLSKGESEPIAEKLTEKGRAKNRRIEITIN